MADPLTTNMQFAVPARGSDVGTWDLPLNGDWSITDAAFGNVSAVGLANAPVTLSISQAQAAVLRFSGVLTGNVVVTLPAITKFWTVQNLTTGNFTVGLTAGGQGIGLPPGNPIDVFSDGTNVYFKNLESVGTYVDTIYAAIPSWIALCTVPPYLPCDGTTFSAATYPALNAILGGTTLPDLRGRARFFLNGGTNRITTAGSGIDGDTRGSVGGAQNVTLVIAQTPSATLSGTTFGPSSANFNGTYASNNNAVVTQAGSNSGQLLGGGGNSVPLDSLSTHTHGFSLSNGGGNGAHTNMPPTQISGITMIRAA